MVDPSVIINGSVQLAAKVISFSSDYLDTRDALKERDKEIAKERKRVSETQGFSSGPLLITNLLHPQHQLQLETPHQKKKLQLETGGVYFCDACNKPIPVDGLHYSCRACNFDVHHACAVTRWWPTTSKETLHTFAHQHPVNLVTESTKFTCSHCNYKSEGRSRYRYQCQKSYCSQQMHLICATNPTSLVTFLHPNHELKLQIRHHFQVCDICHHSGRSNAMVYSCEACDFHVHPECAQCFQYQEHHPSHNYDNHILVYRELPEDEEPRCGACSDKCKYWSYTCYSCEGLHFHRDCNVKHHHTPTTRDRIEASVTDFVNDPDAVLKASVKFVGAVANIGLNY